MGRLDEKVALITGVANGQGRAAALLFAREGAKIAGCDIDKEGAEETAEMVRAAGGIADGRAVDLGSYEDVSAWVDAIAELYGGIDVLYNNAGATKVGPFATGSLDDYRFTMRNGLDVVVFPTRAVWRHLIARGGGAIVNTGTILTHRVTTVPMSLNAAAKGGVAGLAAALAFEGGPHGIRVNTVSPGLIETPPTAPFIRDPTNPLQRQVRSSPLGRVGQPEDVAKVALFLACDDSQYVTGIEIKVDGGQTIGFGASFGGEEFESSGPSNVTINRELQPRVRPTSTVEITTDHGTADGYVFTPGGREDGKWPGVLLYTDVMGVRPVFMSMAQKMADLGYTVLLPNMFYRSGPPLDPPLSARDDAQLTTLLERASLVTREGLESDSRAYVKALHDLPTSSGNEVGCVGYCFSGEMAVWTAADNPGDIGAVATFHGANLATKNDDSPAIIAAGTKTRYYFGHAENDPFMTPEQVALLDRTLSEAGTDYRSEVHPGTFHGFTVLDAQFHAEAAERHYARIGELMATLS